MPAVPIIGAVAGGLIQANSAKSAAKAQTKAADRASEVQWNMFQQSRNDQMPWLQSGSNALGYMNALLGIGGTIDQAQPNPGGQYPPTDVGIPGGPGSGGPGKNPIKGDDWTARQMGFAPTAIGAVRAGQQMGSQVRPPTPQAPGGTPGYPGGVQNGPSLPSVSRPTAEQAFDVYKGSTGYQFRVNQGNQAIDRSAASRGGLKSGATLKALTEYGQGVASDEFNRYLGQLGSIAGVGQSSAQNLGQQGIATGNSIAGNLTNAGNARANAANARGSAYSGIVNDLGYLYKRNNSSNLKWGG